MELKKIELASDEEGDVYPSKITVDMDIKEAIWIASVAGKCRGASPHSRIYDCLVGDLINRYWDDGVDDARRIHPVDIPNISSGSNAEALPRNEKVVDTP